VATAPSSGAEEAWLVEDRLPLTEEVSLMNQRHEVVVALPGISNLNDAALDDIDRLIEIVAAKDRLSRSKLVGAKLRKKHLSLLSPEKPKWVYLPQKLDQLHRRMVS
jgi:hypothetical protein